MWTIIARIILRNRLAFLIGLILFTGFMGYQAQFIQLEYEYAALLPETDSAYINYNDFKELFGEDGNVMIIGVQDSNFFELEKFNDWIKLGNSIKNFDGVVEIVSNARVFNLNKNQELRKFELKEIFPASINNQKDLDSMKAIFYSLPFYNGILYNQQTHVYIMALTIAHEKVNSKERIVLVDSIENQARKFGEKHNLELRFSGLPYTRTRIAQMIEKELVMFIYLAMIVTALLLFLIFRSFKVVLFSMLIVGIGVVWSLGTIVLLGYKITILTGLIPPLLIVIGIPNCVFLLNKYHNEYVSHGNQIKALQRMINKVGNATFLTNLTTASGFATFIITSNRILTQFGIVASLNIMGIFLLSILLIPIFFSFLAPPKLRHTKHLEYKFTEKIIDFLCFLTTNHRKKIYTAIVIFIATAIYGISFMEANGYIVDDIPKDQPIYKDLKFLEENFGGVMPLEIMIDTRKPKGIYKYSNLKKIEQLQDSLKKYPEISSPLSVVEGFKFARQTYFNGAEKHYKLPSSMEFQSAMAPYLVKKGNNNLIYKYVDSIQQITRISLKISDVGTKRLYGIFDCVTNDIDSIFPPAEYKTVLTGSSIVYTKGTSHLIENLFSSLLIAIVLIAVFMSMMFASWRMILVSVVPNLLPLIITAGIMGFAGIAIKPSTVLVFSIAFGISVDNAIHFLAKYRQELAVTNWDIGKSVVLALKETGVSVLYTVTILFFGFGVFVASDFGGTVALGILISITLLIAMFINLILLPSLLLSLERNITTKAFEEPLLSIEEEEENDDDINGNKNKINE